MEDADPSRPDAATGRRSRKRTYEEMSQDTSGESSTSQQQQPQFRQPASVSLNRTFPPPPSPHRYHGDGYDFRRPIMSTSMSGVIDLTDDTEPAPARTAPGSWSQRSQRGSSAQAQRARRNATSQPEVIDLDDDDDSEPQRAHTPQRQAGRDSSPEVEFVASNPLNPNPNSNFTGTLPPMRTAAPTRSDYFRNSAISNSIGMQIARMFADGIRGVNFGRRNLVGVGSLTPHIQQRQQATGRNRRPRSGRPYAMPFQVPGDLDYQHPAFPYPIPEPTASRVPTYQKPSSPHEGFTRAPGEDDIVVCPNCDQELGVGDDDLKRQVWVVRACGHVYCGECTTYRTKSSRKGRADIAVPSFSKCVVDGCDKSKTTGIKAMLQVYI